eukprot:gene779-biopygen6462
MRTREQTNRITGELPGGRTEGRTDGRASDRRPTTDDHEAGDEEGDGGAVADTVPLPELAHPHAFTAAPAAGDPADHLYRPLDDKVEPCPFVAVAYKLLAVAARRRGKAERTGPVLANASPNSSRCPQTDTPVVPTESASNSNPNAEREQRLVSQACVKCNHQRYVPLVIAFDACLGNKQAPKAPQPSCARREQAPQKGDDCRGWGSPKPIFRALTHISAVVTRLQRVGKLQQLRAGQAPEEADPLQELPAHAGL